MATSETQMQSLSEQLRARKHKVTSQAVDAEHSSKRHVEQLANVIQLEMRGGRREP